MHARITDNVKNFRKSMDNGAIYFEYSDGYNIALYRSLYTCEGADSLKNIVYKTFIDQLSPDNRVRYLTKFYYKVENLDDPGSNNQNIWIDMMKVSNVTSGDIYRYAYDYRSSTNLIVNIKNIKATHYIDKEYNIFNIDHHDGKIYDSENICPIVKIPTRDKRFVSVSSYNVDNPSSTKEHLKQDIRIELKSNSVIEYDESVDNTLVWVNGRFVETSKSTTNNKLMYIMNGISALDKHHVGFTGNEPLALKHGEGYPVASYEPDYSRFKFAPDFDINIFKWDNVKISKWNRPFSYKYEKYNYNDGEGFTSTVKSIDSIGFSVPISKSHLIIYNGIVIDMNDYYISDNSIIFNNMKRKVDSIYNDAILEYGKIPNIHYIVESFLPKAEDFRLIQFTHEDPSITVNVNRSSVCYKNHPYPFHVTFPNINVGDMVLLDGMYERYLLHDKNVIRYPYTTYLARYSGRNMLRDTKVERIWLSYE